MEEQTDICTSRDIAEQDHNLFIALNLNSLWTNNSTKFILCVIYSDRQISKCKEMDRGAKNFFISVSSFYIIAKHWIRE